MINPDLFPFCFFFSFKVFNVKVQLKGLEFLGQLSLLANQGLKLFKSHINWSQSFHVIKTKIGKELRVVKGDWKGKKRVKKERGKMIEQRY